MFNSSMKIVATLTGTLLVKRVLSTLKTSSNFSLISCLCVKRSPSRYHFRMNS